MGFVKQLEAANKQFKRSQRIAKADARQRWQTGGLEMQSGMKFDSEMPTDMADAIQRRVMRAAQRKAGNIVKKAQKRRIKRNQSQKTGTRELWTEKAQARNRMRKGLYRSIKVAQRYDKQTLTVITSIGPAATDAWIGWFFETGKSNVYWGREPINAPSDQRPEPFVRPAAAETRAAQQAAIAGHVKANWKKA